MDYILHTYLIYTHEHNHSLYTITCIHNINFFISLLYTGEEVFDTNGNYQYLGNMLARNVNTLNN